MRGTQCHILNGDALKSQFPNAIDGEIIVFRECLVEGPVSDENIDEFFNQRADFLSLHYGSSVDEYREKVFLELSRLKTIDCQRINLWFEDDLFCQSNLWFLLHYIYRYTDHRDLHLVRPKSHNRFGFGGLSEEELINAFQSSIPLDDGEKLSELWIAYCQNDFEQLRAISNDYAFMIPAVQAHIDRQQDGNNIGRPMESLQKIVSKVGDADFATVFKLFSERESIYGFGDLQVKRLLQELNDTIF